MLVRCREPPDAGGWQFSRMNFRASVLPRRRIDRRRPLLPAPGNAAMRPCPTVGPALRRHSVGRRIPDEIRRATSPARAATTDGNATGGLPPRTATILSPSLRPVTPPARSGQTGSATTVSPAARRASHGLPMVAWPQFACGCRSRQPTGMPHGTAPEKIQALPPGDRACTDGGPDPQSSVFSTRPGTTWGQPA